MPTAYLADRSFVRVSGEEAASWLQNIVTCDLATWRRAARAMARC